MNSKQRVYAALRREPADRIPIFMWFHPGTRVLLAKFFEVPAGLSRRRAGQRRADDVGQQQLLHGRRRPRARRPMARRSLGHQVGQGRPLQPNRPLSRWPIARPTNSRATASRTITRRSCWPRWQPVAAQADEYFIGCDISPNVFEMYWRLRGMEQAMIDMAGNPRRWPTRCSAAAPISPSSWAEPPASGSRWTACGPATTWPASGR